MKVVHILFTAIILNSALPVFAAEGPSKPSKHWQKATKKIIHCLRFKFLGTDQASQLQHKLAEVESEPENNYIYKLGLAANEDGSIKRLVMTSENRTLKLQLDDMQDAWVTLAEVGRHKALEMKCPNCTASEGGTVEIRYLVDGRPLFNKHRETKFLLERSGEKGWQLLTGKRELVKKLRLAANTKTLGGTVGIKEIITNPEG